MQLHEVQPIRRIVPFGGETHARTADGDENLGSGVDTIRDRADECAQLGDPERPRHAGASGSAGRARG